ncbi:acyl carrier protein [Umezawaea endophytica]|uniref:Acyl carrier protein n=1 Tax=Umezawaea endophytica TaxID=1654476 RepID=A0A9X2VHK6_9PSEU|nr:acyl carrier protein [Umezawaea endophytica]MCS7476766.1 acyl carrier protein [Umezawaea endophytica]
MSTLEQVREAWADALDVETDAVPLDVSFFEAGGNSLLLLLLWERLTELTARDLKAADLFEHSTVVAQSEFLDGTDERPVVAAASRSALLGRARREVR